MGIHLLFLLRDGWAGATGVLLSLHIARILWAPVAAPIATLPHSGGDLHPLLQDVHLRAAVGHLVLDVPHAAVVQEGLRPDRRLLLPDPGQGGGHVHHAISSGKWDRWKEDWVVVRADVHDHLVLPTMSLTAKKTA
jgi:hypothetical protein